MKMTDKPNSLSGPQILFAYTPLLIGLAFSSAGCSTLQKGKVTANSKSNPSARIRPRVSVTSVRDPLIRGELRSEINSLHDYEKALSELRAQFERDPLPGPITLVKLEADLAAQYRAKMMEQNYAANSKQSAALATDGAKVNHASVKSSSQQAQEARKSETQSGTVQTALAQSATRTPAHEVARAPALLPTTLTEDAPSLANGQGSAGVPSSATEIENAVPSSNGSAMAGLPGAALEPGLSLKEAPKTPATLKRIGALENAGVELSSSAETPLIFDYPVTYNTSVKRWIHYFQTSGRSSFRSWLERSSRYLPFIQYELTRAGLPQDLAYVAMIESGFSSNAVSHASAMGLWQFIVSTGNRFGLKTEWWIDERKDFLKSTRAAISYMTELYQQFNSWYLVAASYNMGENGVRRLMQRHRTNNFWDLADRRALPEETRHYVPKIIAAMLISKAPALYGFRELNYQMPLAYEYFNAPGGTDLVNLARFLGVSDKYMRDLNPELVRGFIPRQVKYHRIRVPKGSVSTVAEYVAMQTDN
jgi:membrane-bound lytic murein transglycosylase D